MKRTFLLLTACILVFTLYTPNSAKQANAANECGNYPESVSGNFENQISQEYVNSLLHIHFKLKSPTSGETLSFRNHLLNRTDCTRVLAFSPYFSTANLPAGIKNFSIRFQAFYGPWARYYYRIYNDDTNLPVNCSGCNVTFDYPVFFNGMGPHKDVMTLRLNDATSSTFTTKPIDLMGNNAKNPLLIIPGIMGSEIYHDNEKIWLDISRLLLTNNDTFLNSLNLDSNGEPVESTRLGDILSNPNSAFNYSQKLVDDLSILNYKQDETLYTFPYDWRKDIREVALNELKAKIDSIVPEGSNKKMDIVAHSQGGLVIKYLLYKEPAYQNKIDKLIIVGTPHLGAPKAAKVLLYGDSMGIDVLGLGLDHGMIKKLARNMPSVYGLLPSREYFNHQDSYLGEVEQVFLGKDKIKSYDYSGSRQYLTEHDMNSYLLEKADQLHEQDFDNFNFSNPNINTFNIIGCEEATIGKIFYRKNKKVKIDYVPGDGTVPLVSASNFNAKKTYYSTNTEHGRMLTLDSTKNQILKILQDKPSGVVNEIYTDPSNCKFNGKTVSVHSPVELHIYDETGNHAGPSATNGFDYEIEGVRYDVFGEEKFAFLPAGKKYTIELPATDNGYFDFYSSNVSNGETTQTSFFRGIRISANSKAKTEISNEVVENLFLDFDGNGEYEQQILPTSTLGSEAEDLLPPELDVNLSGAEGASGWFKSNVTININAKDVAQDNITASGLLEIQYKLDENNWQSSTENIGLETYNEGEHSLEVYAVDNIGNESGMQTYKFYIDKTPPEVEVFFDTDAKDINFKGVDNLDSSPIIVDANDIVSVQDKAGNLTRLVLEEKNRKEKQKATLLSLDQNELYWDLNDNKFSFSWEYGSTGNLSRLEQKAKNKLGFSIEALFAKGETKLTGQDSTGKFNNSFTGLKLLVLETHNKTLQWHLE